VRVTTLQMGCTSSHLFEDDEEYSRFGGPASGFGHHIVSLTSTTYGLLTLDSPQTTPVHHAAPPPTKIMISPAPPPEPAEIINSWELMAGLDNDSFRFSPIPLRSSPSSVLDHPSLLPRPAPKPPVFTGKENKESRPIGTISPIGANALKPLNGGVLSSKDPVKCNKSLDGFERRCPPGGENAVVVYTTTLRGIRKTFEDCNAVRAALEGAGVWMKERDVSMHLGYREELKELMGSAPATVPRVFVRGRYIGGAEEVLKMHEEGVLIALLEGLPKAKMGAVCDGCGGARFLPCLGCNGSCKLVREEGKKVVKCPDCNENGLILCPICS
ncbi:hypothetical protein ACLOJK_006304, partial [Asimina triloba]